MCETDFHNPSLERTKMVFSKRWHAAVLLAISLIYLLSFTPTSINDEENKVNEKITTHSSPKTVPPILPSQRSQRFPSVAQRVRFYMSSWYHCKDQSLSLHRINATTYWVNRQWVVSNTPRVDALFSLNFKKLSECTQSTQQRPSMRKAYCPELLQNSHLLSNTTTATRPSPNEEIPLIFQVGDAFRSKRYYLKRQNWWTWAQIPHFKKIRPVWNNDPNFWNHNRTTDCPAMNTYNPLEPESRIPRAQPILWKLESARHYDGIEKIYQWDIPFDQKKNQSVFRGSMTGKSIECNLNPRCRLVTQYLKSPLVDAKLTGTDNPALNSNLLGPTMEIADLLRYKCLVIIQGNDVATGLKWALLSQSVVLMPKPTVTSWLMEELLEPFVHYVPLADDLSNVESQTQWVLDHPRWAQQIAQRATLWMQDLLHHPEAAKDNNEIERTTLTRYQQLWSLKKGNRWQKWTAQHWPRLIS